MYDPDRDVEKIAAVALHHRSQPVHELGQSGVRNEILLENVGVPQAVLEVVHIVAHLLVGGYEAGIRAHRPVAGDTRVRPWAPTALPTAADGPRPGTPPFESDVEP